jgi:hypothetical protein
MVKTERVQKRNTGDRPMDAPVRYENSRRGGGFRYTMIAVTSINFKVGRRLCRSEIENPHEPA